jgi:hypothetical protein
LARLTVACTLGSLFRLFSMRVAQAAQVIPSIDISICLRFGEFKIIPDYLSNQHIPHRGICQYH